MAENLWTTDQLNQRLQHSLTIMSDNEEVVPRTPIPYELSLGPVEEPFDPISIFAIRESQGPLNEEQLKLFLGQKHDMRSTRRIIPEIQVLTNGIQVGRFVDQLWKLESRMTEIQNRENELMNLVKKRIKEMIEAMENGNVLPRRRHHSLEWAIVVQKAIQTVGARGPLTADNLKSIIITGSGGFPSGILNDISPDGENPIIQQLKELKKRIKFEEGIQKMHFNVVYGNTKKTRYDITQERLQLP